MDTLILVYIGSWLLGFLGLASTCYFSIRRIRTNDLRHIEERISGLRVIIENRCDRLEDKFGEHIRDYHLK